jgi:hypothetical protein
MRLFQTATFAESIAFQRCTVLTCTFPEWQADNVAKYMDSKDVEYFAADKGAGKGADKGVDKGHVRQYGDGKGEAPVKEF